MRKNKLMLGISAILLAIGLSSFTKFQAYKETIQLKESLKLTSIAEGGTNGLAVVYNPLSKVYYTAYAGNQEFPLEMFNEKGENIPSNVSQTGFDARTIWLDPSNKTLYGLCYSDAGAVKYKIDNNGQLIAPMQSIKSGMFQPNAQSAGSVDNKNGLIYFINPDNMKIEIWKTSFTKKKSKLKLECKSSEYNKDAMSGDYNGTVVYTGIKGKELALLDIVNKKIEYYSVKSGKLSATANLPESINFEMQSIFNFTYSNGMFWIFDIELREWHGLKQ